jgi:hypothetical protein
MQTTAASLRPTVGTLRHWRDCHEINIWLIDYVSHFLTDLDEIRYNRSPGTSVEQLSEWTFLSYVEIGTGKAELFLRS